MKKLVSVVIRTLNEERYLEELLSSIWHQNRSIYDIEVVIVDSGSSDNTLSIAEKWECRVTHIKKEEFTFGRSLNIGCEFSKGDFIVFISGHCVPCDEYWINSLIQPLESDCAYTYGRQVARDGTKYSEEQLFKKYFPLESRIPQEGFFVNNANSAIRKDIWYCYNFDEELTGCEDMFLAKILTENGLKVGYVAEAPVYHIHNESWAQVQTRYEREALALQKIMPQVHITFVEVIKYIAIGILKDVRASIKDGVFIKNIHSIVRFRIAQYFGAYKGNHQTRRISKEMKERYFYPRITNMDIKGKY